MGFARGALWAHELEIGGGQRRAAWLCWRGPSLYVRPLTYAASPGYYRAACRHGHHVCNRYITGSNRALSSSCGVVVGGDADSRVVVVVVVIAAVAAVAAVITKWWSWCR